MGEYNGPCSDDSVRTNVYALDHNGSCADVRTRTDVNLAAQHRSWCDVRVRVDYATVVQTGACVDNAILLDYTARLKNCPGHDLNPICQLYFGRDDRTWMNHRCKVVAAFAEGFVHPKPICDRCNRTDSVDQQRPSRFVPKNGIVAPKMGDSQKLRSRFVRINRAKDSTAQKQKST
jgi:hypothetical protein